MWRSVLVAGLLFILTVHAESIPMCSQDGKISVTENVVDDGDVRQIFWAEVPPNEIYYKHESIFIISNNWTLWRSVDDGKTLERQPLSTPVISIIPTASPQILYFLSKDGNMWTTINQGISYEYVQVSNFKLSSQPMPHPSRPEWALGLGVTPACSSSAVEGLCIQTLYLTKDLGNSWTPIRQYVNSAKWGTKGDSVFFTTWKSPSGDQRTLSVYNMMFTRFQDVLKNETDYAIYNVIGYLISNNTVFLGKVKSTGAELELWVSQDYGNTFAKTKFPTEEKGLKENGYAIVDLSEKVAFININHGKGHWGNTYTSGSFERDFVESLEFTKRSLWGSVDFRRINGINGIYIANRVINPKTLDEEQNVKFQSVISYDMGSEWNFLQKPKNSEFSSCVNCSLHLHGESSSTFGQVYSVDYAAGLILSTGIVSNYLSSNDPQENLVGTFFSRDAGVSWDYVTKGEYTYEFGNHGSLILLVSTEKETNELLYTTNEGLTWNKCLISNSPVNITNIRIEPSGRSRNFLMHGVRKNNSEGIVMHIDFDNFFPRTCNSSDYENWSPSFGNNECLLGSKYSFKRRIRNSNCFNPYIIEKKSFVENCNCTRNDYECDFCFDKDPKDSDKCVLVCEDDWKKIIDTEPSTCVDYWYRTRGYRKIFGDECVENVTLSLWAPERVLCSSAGSGTSGGIGAAGWFGIILSILILLFVSAIVAVILVAKKNQEFREKVGIILPGWLRRPWDTLMSSSNDYGHLSMEGIPGATLEEDF